MSCGQLKRLLDEAAQILLGKRQQIELAVCCLLARGHLLIEDIPGIGKTTLAQTLAQLMGLSWRRVQFTSDLLPADILGCVIYEQDLARFSFRPGPIFHQLLLADEINRASPKTQSALLEAMEERQVSIEGQTYPLPKPFFVIATQNPLQTGTFPLPESQLDRFLMRLRLGYPDRASERLILKGRGFGLPFTPREPCLSPEALLALQAQVDAVYASEALLDYLQDLLEASRTVSTPGLSPRAGLGLLQAAKAWAWLQGRDSVWPEDLQAVFEPVTSHRLEEGLSARLLETVPIP